MGWLSRRRDEYNETKFYYQIGCEVMGPPSTVVGIQGTVERADRVKAGKKEHARRQAAAAQKQQFGSGDSYGDRNWSAPVHGTTSAGEPVTISFGQGPRSGETLISDGHVDASTFYGSRRQGKGHDHYLVDGSPAADRRKYRDE